MYAARTRLVALAAAAAVAATSVRADRCCEQAKAMGVYDVEDTAAPLLLQLADALAQGEFVPIQSPTGSFRTVLFIPRSSS